VFLDRDGTVINDRGYLADPSGVELVDGAAPALRSLHDGGVLLVLVSNQSGIARGLIRREDHARVHARLEQVLSAEGVVLDAYYYCEHGPDDDCECRKPRPGMLRTAAREHGIDLAASFMVGDKRSDVAAGHAAGCTSVLFGTDAGDLAARDWPTLCATLSRRLS
jgi:D-glycero-D-manno-heptose 1,7-bisphosphate phosphatase